MLSYEELILLDALTYYKSFSGVSDGWEDDELPTVSKAIEIIENGNITCFDGILGLNDSDLGMHDVLRFVKSNQKLLNLKIVYPDQGENLETTSSVCMIDTESNEIYVIFGGNYIAGAYEYDKTEMGTWADNFIGAFKKETDEQKRALDFYKDAMIATKAWLTSNDYDISEFRITVSGHSAAGNQAQYVTLLYDGEYEISSCVSIDGQGFS